MADKYQPLNGQDISDNHPPRQGRNASSRGESSQTRTALIWQALGWLVTAIFCAFILITIQLFEEKGVVTKAQKHTFNTIITALILGLGLNFFVRHYYNLFFVTCKDSQSARPSGSVQVLCQSFSREAPSAAATQRSRETFD